MKTTFFLISVLAVAAACKPKDSGSEVQSIVGTNADGKEAAMSLVPVRNFTVAKLAGGSNDAGVLQASAMIKARLFALVECVGAGNVTAAEMMSLVEARAAIDDLYLDERRHLVTSASDDGLAQFGSAQNKLVTIGSCHVHGRRLISWNVISDLQTRAVGLPKALPASGADRDAVLKTFGVVQSLHLALRGSYSKNLPNSFFPRVPAMIDMMREQAGFDASVAALASRLMKADRLYNPCDESSTAGLEIAYANQLKKNDFSCVPHGKIKNAFNYRAGGVRSYEQVKNGLAAEFEASHNAVFQGGDPALLRLWDLVTSAESWAGTQGDSRELAKYLTTGQGVDFNAEFDSRAKEARSAGSAPQVKAVDNGAAPLVAFVETSGGRAQQILRATAGTGAGRGVLSGGFMTTTDKRSDSAKARASAVAPAMGTNGAAHFADLVRDTAGALKLVRQ